MLLTSAKNTYTVINMYRHYWSVRMDRKSTDPCSKTVENKGKIGTEIGDNSKKGLLVCQQWQIGRAGLLGQAGSKRLVHLNQWLGQYRAGMGEEITLYTPDCLKSALMGKEHWFESSNGE